MATMVKAGRYEILGELGRGAMGVVYRATDPVIGRAVAVKTIRLSEEGTGLSRQELLSRFQTEARAAGLLTHPNIVVVYDAGEENGLFYITMELIEGKSIQSLLDAGHAFPVPRVLRIMEQACSALQFAHDRNIVHRDIKPANLMLTADDTVKVTDFGTAKILQFGTVQQTQHVMGTPSYMSPEQVKGRPVDGRSDIFSLGVLLYEVLTGEKPFPGQTITTVIYKIVNEDPIAPRTLNPSLHPGLSDIVMRALAKDPEVRYQSCREMLEDLRNYRALGVADRNSPEATLISPRNTPIFPLGIAGGGMPAPPADDPNVSPTIRALQNRATSPGQTPAVRRTGPIAPVEEPQKKSPVVTVFLALLLIGVIVYGFNKLRPEFQATRELNERARQNAVQLPPAPKPAQPEPQAPTTTAPVNVVPSNSSATDPVAMPEPARPEPTPAPTSVAEKKVTPAPTAEVKKSVPTVTPAAAEYKAQVEEALADRGAGNRVQVEATSNTLTLSGKLRPAEHSQLLHFMRNAPSNVRVVDEIAYDDTPLPASQNADNSGHPVPSPGNAAVHVLTNVLGAKATLFGANGRAISICQTPCSFNDLAPARYSLQVQKDGYLQVQTALELKTGDSQDEKIQLEALQKGLYVNSHPAGADIFINGDKQSGQTPTNLPLAAGSYNLVLRLEGYDPYVGQVQVKDNVQTTLDLELQSHAAAHVAWAQVTSTPAGAEIFVDGTSSGVFAPARVQIPSGTHTIGLRLQGYEFARRGIEASEGGTVLVNAKLQPK